MATPPRTPQLVVQLDELTSHLRKLAADVEGYGSDPVLSGLACELRSNDMRRIRAALIRLSGGADT